MLIVRIIKGKTKIGDIKISKRRLYCPLALSFFRDYWSWKIKYWWIQCLCLLSCPVVFSLCLSSLQLVLHYFLDSSWDSQSSPSYSPVPWVAQVDWMCQVLLRRELRPSFSVSSPTFKALGRSCLLANTSKTASFSSSSDNIFVSSSDDSATLSLSLLSTTKMSPCVFWK